jgi:hypothetical protein
LRRCPPVSWRKAAAEVEVLGLMFSAGVTAAVERLNWDSPAAAALRKAG